MSGGHFAGGFAGTNHYAAAAGGHVWSGGYAGHVGGSYGHPSYSGHPGWSGNAGWSGHPGWNGHPGWGGHPGGWVGGSGRHWGGGYWGGRFWPGAYYGANFAWFLPVLPFGYATYWSGSVPYYYYNSAYYLWDPSYNGYVATDPPPAAGTDATSPPAGSNVESSGAVTGGGASDIYVYPRNGQTDEQTANDRFECHKWAVSQTGFDPTRSENQGTADDYRRAIGACLDARGYSVK